LGQKKLLYEKSKLEGCFLFFTLVLLFSDTGPCNKSQLDITLLQTSSVKDVRHSQ